MSLTPDEALPPPERPALHPEMPLMVVLNAASGRHGERQPVDLLRSCLQEVRHPHELHVVRRPRELAVVTRRAAQSALGRSGALVAVGGDGTLNTVAAEAWRLGLPLGVLPQGTFNYFGRAHGIPQALEAAFVQMMDGVRAGRLRPVQVGLLNGQLFLVNASVGLYPQLLQDREAFKQRLGRSRWVAAWAALSTLLSPHPDLFLHLGADESPAVVVRTPTLFVGNNPLQMAQVGMPEADAVGRGALLASTLRPVGRWGLLKLALLGALGRLGEAEAIRHGAVQALQVCPVGAKPRRGWRALRVAIDGETRWVVPPLRFEVAPRPLWLLGVPPGPRVPGR